MGLVFIIGLASAPEDVVFAPHAASDTASDLQLKTANIDSTKKIRKIGMLVSDSKRRNKLGGIKFMSSNEDVIIERSWFSDDITDAEWRY